ncbi:MAG: hypothetical protein EOP36_18930 [Rubrivivax sp.]|nr:MAG: hypothetical protein EOP36_18930 [Rubrivivax sp.]
MLGLRSVPVAALVAGLSCLATLHVQAQSAPTSLEAQYREGLYQRETGRPYSAIETLESILAANPTLNRARLEVAVAYYRTLNFAKARAQAQAVLDDPTTPEAVRLSVLSFIKQLELDEAAAFGRPHKLDYSLSLGAVYDSNVNAGPDNAVLPGGLVLEPGATDKSDSGYLLQAGISHSWLSPTPVRSGESTGRFGWNSSVGVYYKGYGRYNEYNLGVLTAATGPALIMGKNWRGNLSFQADRLTLGDKKLALYTSVSPSATWRLGSGNEFTADAQLAYRNFARPEDQARDSHYNSLGFSYGGLYNSNRLTVQAGVRTFDEDAQEARYSNNGYEVFMGGRQNVWTGGDLFARAAWRHSGYDDVEPIYGIVRREDEYRLEFGASHQFDTGWLDQWQGAATFTIIQNKANLVLYEYDRNTLQITLGRSY